MALKEPCFLCHRQCALVALQDVKAYLTKEGGQIAVSPIYLSAVLSIFLSVCWLISKRFKMSITEMNPKLSFDTHIMHEKYVLYFFSFVFLL